MVVPTCKFQHQRPYGRKIRDSRPAWPTLVSKKEKSKEIKNKYNIQETRLYLEKESRLEHIHDKTGENEIQLVYWMMLETKFYKRNILVSTDLKEKSSLEDAEERLIGMAFLFCIVKFLIWNWKCFKCYLSQTLNFPISNSFLSYWLTIYPVPE